MIKAMEALSHASMGARGVTPRSSPKVVDPFTSGRKIGSKAYTMYKTEYEQERDKLSGICSDDVDKWC